MTDSAKNKNENINERCAYYFDCLLDLQLKSIEDMCKYNTVVCSIGYVSILAILTYLHDYMYRSFLCTASLFYVFSVVIFVFFEMRKIFINNSYRKKVMANLDEYRQGNIDKHALTDANLDKYCESYNDFIKHQSWFFMPSAVFGFGAGLIIVLNFVIIAFKEFLRY